MTDVDNLLHTRDVVIPRLIEKSLSVPGHITYVNTEFYREGGTRFCYKSASVPSVDAFTQEQLDKMDLNVLFKFDKCPQDAPTPSTVTAPAARRHVGRGYTTINDARVLTIIANRSGNPHKHHINKIYGFGTVQLGGQRYHVSAEEFFESQTLEEKIESDGPFKKRLDFERAFGQILEAERYLISELGILHRDPKPSNWLINDAGEIRLTDFANAAETINTNAKYYPTAGSHFLMRPSLIGALTGQKTVYTERDEHYALGVLAMYMLTGKYHLEYSPDSAVGIRLSDNADILQTAADGEKTFSIEKHNKVWEEAIGDLPWAVRRRHKPMLDSFIYLTEDDLKYVRGGEQ